MENGANDTLRTRLAFASLPTLGPEAADELLRRCGGTAAFFAMSRRELAARVGSDSHFFDDEARRRALERGEAEERFVTSNGITALWFQDPEYPRRLAQIPDAPTMLFVLGNVDFEAPHTLSVVGTRHATAYGTDFTTRFVTDLAGMLQPKPLVVSGLAYGIDIAAHLAAVNAGAPTVAVLAHGFHTIYPAAHRDYAKQILSSGGALVTEYFSGTSAARRNFLARNRIVAGLTDATAVMESDVRGGALATARLAMEYNRDVFALPGRVSDQYSRGCNNLIARQTAAILTSATQFAESMRWAHTAGTDQQAQQPQLFTDLNPLEKQIVDHLTYHGQARLSDLRMATNEPIPKLMSTMVDMEFRGLVVSMPGSCYTLAARYK